MTDRQDVMLHNVIPSEYSHQFHQGMVDRMNISLHKYGPVVKGFGPEGGVDALKSLKERVAKYEETGNTEWLIDVGNFAMIEFVFPRHAAAHFRATDSKESPGRMRTDGRWVGSAHNLDV